MRLLVCEYLTGGGLAGRPLGRLAAEGDIMLQALVADLAELPGIELLVARDARLRADGLPGEVVPVGPAEDPWRAWRAALRRADALWPIAPEPGGHLERLCGLALAERRLLLGCRPEAVRVAASARAVTALLARAGVPVVPTVPAAAVLAGGPPPRAPGGDGWVLKPDQGAGAEEVALVGSPAELRRRVAAAPDRGRLVVQPHLPGAAASLSLLCDRGRARILSCNLQAVRREGGWLRYRGGVVGGSEGRRAAYAPLAAGVAAALQGLWGHVGVDLVDDGHRPMVIEVNPRLCLPYAGLRPVVVGAGRFPSRTDVRFNPSRANPAALALALLDRDG